MTTKKKIKDKKYSLGISKILSILNIRSFIMFILTFLFAVVKFILKLIGWSILAAGTFYGLYETIGIK